MIVMRLQYSDSEFFLHFPGAENVSQSWLARRQFYWLIFLDKRQRLQLNRDQSFALIGVFLSDGFHRRSKANLTKTSWEVPASS